MRDYKEHKVKIRETVFHYRELADSITDKNIRKRILRISEIAVIIEENTQDRHGELKGLTVPILPTQSLVQKLMEHNITKGLSVSSLMPDIRELESYVGVKYIPADLDSKKIRKPRMGKYS